MFVNVLCGNLPVCDELVEHAVGSDETSLAMGDGDGVHIAHLRLGKPRRQVRRDACAYKTALVASDGVERKRRALRGHRHNVAEGHETELDERLEPVADAEHETVTVVEQVAHGLGDRRCTEERRDELRGAIRFVAA